MLFTSDYFTSSDRSTPEEPIHNPHPYQQYPQESLDQQVSQRMPQSLEPQKSRRKKRKPAARRTPRARVPISSSKVGNEYSAIMSLGFVLITFLFLSIAAFVIGYIFTYTFNPTGADALWKAGSLVLTPLLVLVFCILAMVIILEPFRR